NDPAANAADDAAIATDKGALLDGETASFRNVSMYWRGINGLMVDLALPPAPAAPPGGADFRLETGDGGGTWTPLAAAPVVSVRPGAGASGTDRVTLILPEGAVRNTWLRVTV